MCRVARGLLFSIVFCFACANPMMARAIGTDIEKIALPQTGAATSQNLKLEQEKALQSHVEVLTQKAFGGISGTVSDASGAIIPNATVTILNKATNATWTARTDSQGRFSVGGLPPGPYSVSIEAIAFQKRILDGVTVSPQQSATVKAVLSLPIKTKLPGAMPPPPPPPPQKSIPLLPPGSGSLQGSIVGHNPPQDSVQSVKLAPAPTPVAPTPAPKPAVTPTGAPKPTAKPPDQVASDDKAFEDWHKSLPEGLSEHHVDPLMRLGKDSAVTFTIHGHDAPVFTPQPGSTPEKLQVSPMMSVYLTQPDNPDGFKIVDSDTPQNPKRVAPDGTTTWTWIVTPQQLGPLKLHIAAYVLRGDNESDRASYKSYDDTIQVKTVTLWGYLTTGLIWILNNPAASLKWILPGGAGAAMIGKLIHWLVTRKKKPAPDGPDDKSST